MPPPVSIVFVRELPEQLTGSGCCGKVRGDTTLTGCEQIFSEARQTQELFGVLHRAVREFFPPREGLEQVSMVSVDPRNQLYLVPKLWGDVWRYRPGVLEALRTLLQTFSLPAVIVNGRVLSRPGRMVDPDALCHAVATLLEPDAALPSEQEARG